MRKCKADITGRCSFDCKNCIYSDIDHFRELFKNKNQSQVFQNKK
ncbi:MAG: hypothetical protein ACTSQJ_06075 [Promethearchaeota archaeon]